MRIGLNLLCITGAVDITHLPLIEEVAAIGYDGVEVPVLSGEPAHYERLGNAIDALGLARTVTAITPTPQGNPLSPDADVRALGIKHLDWILDCTIALGSQSVGGPFHAPLGVFTGTGPTADEIRWGADAHYRMAERAAANGIVLSLEPLNRFETHFLNTMAQARAYAERVDHPAFRIMYDTFHAHIEEKSQPEAIATLGDYLGVVHVSENDRGIPGTGQIDFPEIFRALRTSGFDGWMVVEAFGDALPELAAATRVWRPLFPDPDTLFTKSYSYITRNWDQTA